MHENLLQIYKIRLNLKRERIGAPNIVNYAPPVFSKSLSKALNSSLLLNGLGVPQLLGFPSYCLFDIQQSNNI